MPASSFIESLEPRQLLAGTPTFVVAFDDHGGFYSQYYNRVRSTILAAAADWAQYIDSDARIELAVDFDSTLTSPVLATAGFDRRIFFRNASGYDVYQGNVGAELRTGVDANGADPDAEISIRPGALNEFFFDSTADHSGNLPDDRIDARSVFMHELGHALGIFGDGDGDHDSPAGNRLTFDQYVQLNGNDLYFTGPNAMAAYGKPVPLSHDDSSHVGNDDGPGVDLTSDLMSPFIDDGQKRTISAVDRGLIADAGVPLKSTTAPYVSVAPATATRGVDNDVDFTFTLSEPALALVTVPVTSINGTAAAGRDFLPVNATVTFQPGQTTQTLAVSMLSASVVNQDRTFTLNLGLPANAVSLTGQVKGTIRPGALMVDARHGATFTDPNGAIVSVSLSGPGVATIHRDPAGLLDTISVAGSTGATVLGLRSSRGTTTLHGIDAPAGLGGVNAGTVNFIGSLNLAGANMLSFLDIAAGSTIHLSAVVRPAVLVARNVTDASITLDGPIKSATFFSWMNTDGTADLLTASSIAALTVKAALSANIVSAGSIGMLNVGALRNATITAAGSVNSATFASIDSSNFFVGATTWADDAADFTNPAATLKSLTIKGAGLFSNTRIAAAHINTAQLGSIRVANGGVPFGLASESIGSVTGSTPLEPRFKRLHLLPPSTVSENDFVIRLV